MHVSNKNEYPEPQPFRCILCLIELGDREELCTHIVKHSDQIAAFNKEKAKQDKLVGNSDEMELLTELKQTSSSGSRIGSVKCDENVIRKNRIILKGYKAMFKPSHAFMGMADASENKHKCQMCGNVFKSREFLFNHVKIHI